MSSIEAVQVDRAQAAEVLKAKKVELVIRLAPSSETICRVLPMPAVAGADRASLADALSLLAESELPASLPWYRRAAGIMRLGSSPAVLVTGWNHPSSSPQATPTQPLSTVPEVWAAELSAVAWLGTATSAGPMVGLADAQSGTLAMIAAGPKRTIARVLRLSTGDAWAEAARSAWSETAAAAGLEMVAMPSTDGLMLPLATSARLGGASRDREWINRFGLAFGALSLYADPDAAVSSLVALTPEEPRRQQPLAQRAVDWLSLPRHAGMVAAACIAIALLAPLGAAKARHTVLAQRAGSVDALDTRLAEAERRVGFYRLLGEKRWPMTKLLAQIAGAAPVGVTIESVELPQGETVTIRATADSSELVSTFRKNLSDTRVFTGVATPSIDATEDGVTFQLQARVVQNFALQATKPLDDFAAETLAQRLYGEGARNTARADFDDDDEVDSPRSSERRSSSRDSDRGDSGRSGGTSRSPDRSSAAAPPVIPPPLSDEDIAKMDRSAAMKAFGQRRNAASQPGIDAETKARLLAESEKAKARMQEATTPAAGVGGGGT